MKRALLILAATLAMSACDGSNKDRLSDAQAEAPSVGPELENAGNMEDDVNASNDAASNMALEQPAANTVIAGEASKPKLDANGPSFACAGLLSRVEDMICSNPELGSADRAASDLYAKATKQASADQKERLRAIGRQFLTDRNRCPDAACVSQAYVWYVDDVNGLMGWPST